MGAYEQPDYPTLADLLASMDHLGIWQTVAYHSNARDLHPVYGNRFLLEDLENTPGAKERVIPALAANPAMLVGKGEMEHLVDCLASGKAACVILFPVTNRFRLVEYCRVFQRIRQFRPVILMDVAEMTADDIEDLAQIAPEYPELNFVVKQVMWQQFSKVFDLLHRVENIYIDISWLHTRDAIRMVRDHVSYQRLIFGVGFRSHRAAAMAGLSWADISQKEKDAVSWDNFAALLPEDARAQVAANRRSIHNQITNRFWNDFLDEKGVHDVLVIDAHSHIGPFARSWYLRENEIEDQIKTLEQELDCFGINKIISQPETALFGQPIQGNRMVEEAIGSRTDRFRGNLVFNPIYSHLYTREVLDQFFSGGYYCGFKLLPEYLGVDVADERFRPAYEYANEHHMHILFHSWEGKCGTAQQIADIAVRYPNATFIIGHTGGGTQGRRQCEAIAQDPKYANCVFEFCGTFTTEVLWEDTLQKIDSSRVVFGTDTVVHDIAWEMGRLLSLDIPDCHLEKILGANMQKILDRTILPSVSWFESNVLFFEGCS